MSYPTPLYYHFIFALELKHIADWQDRKNNDNELCINENLNSSLSNFGKLVRLWTPECYLSCSWQETLQLVLGHSVCAKQNSLAQHCGPWSLSSSTLMAKEGNKHFFLHVCFLCHLLFSWCEPVLETRRHWCERHMLPAAWLWQFIELLCERQSGKNTVLHSASRIWCSRMQQQQQQQQMLSILFLQSVKRWHRLWYQMKRLLTYRAAADIPRVMFLCSSSTSSHCNHIW